MKQILATDPMMDLQFFVFQAMAERDTVDHRAVAEREATEHKGNLPASMNWRCLSSIKSGRISPFFL